MAYLSSIRCVVVAVLVALGLAGVGCSDDNSIDHTPPPGQGSLVVDNNTSDTIDIFVGGGQVGQVGGGKRLIIDLSPRADRIVLTEDGGDRSYRGNLDIIEGRLTVYDVAYGPPYFYDLYVYFD